MEIEICLGAFKLFDWHIYFNANVLGVNARTSELRYPLINGGGPSYSLPKYLHFHLAYRVP